jgi:hypothetical protein
MKKIYLLISVSVMFLSVNINAQEAVESEGGIERLTSFLDLSKEQVAELKLISNESKEEMKLLRANDAIGDAEKKKAIKTSRSNREVEMITVFNAEQAEKYLAMLAEQKAAKQKTKDRMANELGLSDEQNLAMNVIKEKSKAERMAINSNESLSKEEKYSQLKGVRKKAEVQIKEILTVDQYAKLKEKRSRQRK